MGYQFDVSLILACYNEAEHFNSSVDRIIKVLDGTDFSWEIIFIDDASIDTTADLIKSYINKTPRKHLTAYSHLKNLGRGAAVTEGIEKSQGKIVGYIDIDCEVPPDYIPQFVSAIDNGADLAIGWRIYDFTFRSLPRWFASKGYNRIRNAVLNNSLKDTEAGYKFFNLSTTMDVIEQTNNNKWFWDTEIVYKLLSANKKIKEIACIFIRNNNKKSTVKLLPDIWDYLKAIIKFKK